MEDLIVITKIAIITVASMLAFVPILLWGYHFYKKHAEKQKYVVLTFVAGALSVIPLLSYRLLWNYFPWINAFLWTRNLKADLVGFSTFALVPISVIATFMLVGIIEETSKMLAVRTIDVKVFKSIDDVIEFAIIAALGFSFIENIIYFYNIISVRGFEQLLFPFIFRSLFSTFAHIMFSGIFGYYYGIGYFANKELKSEIRKNRHPFLKFFHKYFHFKENILFKDEKVLEGLFVATTLHAVFNIFLEMEWTFLIVPFLFSGYLMLNYLLNRKESLKEYGRVY
ncbi:PrsW family intramembrane metalloprotease [bacterium]|nr:PrsW family intramembrane metalloprotease [bacterium]